MSRKKIQIVETRCKTLLTCRPGNELPFRWDINIYRGCQHGCPYCFARYTHEFLNESVFDFEKKIFVKVNAPEILDYEISRPTWQHEIISFGNVTDAYQPTEWKYQLTRQCLKVLLKHWTPVTILTKSPLVLRDTDVLREIGDSTFCNIAFSITTSDDTLRKKIEPHAPSVTKRWEAATQLKRHGFRVGVLMMPILPFITDTEENIEGVIKTAVETGIDYLFYGMLHLRSSAYKRFMPFLRVENSDVFLKYCKPYQHLAYLEDEFSKPIFDRVEAIMAKYNFKNKPSDQVWTWKIPAGEQLTLWDSSFERVSSKTGFPKQVSNEECVATGELT
jgi:DNA repair photolyase